MTAAPRRGHVRVRGLVLLGLAAAACGRDQALVLAPRARCRDVEARLGAVTARSADALVEAFGVGVRHYPSTPYADVPAVQKALAELGARHVFDAFNTDRAWLRALREVGPRATLGPYTETGPPPPVDVYGRELPNALGGLVLQVPASPGSPGEWAKGVREAFAATRQALRAHPAFASLPIVGPGLPEAVRGAVGDLSAYVDAHQVNVFPARRSPGEIDLQAAVAPGARIYPGRPPLAVQFGYSTSTTPDGVPEDVQAAYQIRLWLRLMAEGFAGAWSAQLFDWSTDDNYISRLGLVRVDGTRKPAFTAFANLLALLDDRGGPHPVGALPFEIVGAPPTIRSLLAQNRAGLFFLVLWLEVPAGARAPSVEIQVRFGAPVAEAATIEISRSPLPAARRESPEALPVTIGEMPVVLRIVPACDPS